METASKSIISMINRDTLCQPKILLVEDCKCDSVLIKHILCEYYPFTLFDSAETKSEALQFLSNNEYDIVLLDLNLPDTVGLEDIGEIRKVCSKTPLIIMTGGYNETSKAAAQKFGANGIIAKSDLIDTSFPSIVEKAAENVVHL